ncbi:MAG: serine/threonine protein kinase [Planctomycetes bacterium]|nr:serine/threonine protein kinase [Planctomycetota bacterium]
MNADELERAFEIYRQALEQPAGERTNFLSQACANDDELRDCLELVLAAKSAARQERPNSTRSEPAASEETLPGHIQSPRGGAAGFVSSPIPAIEGYEILRELGRGGQAVVYLAIQKSTKRKVGIKILLEGAYASRTALKRFEREIDLMAQFKHPNIISIFDSGVTADSRHYYVMDYVRGKPLNQYARERKLSLEDTLRLFATICQAVQYAHQKGVIHRDLKPPNILVDAEGHPSIMDFGLAKFLTEPVDTIVSMTQQVIGTVPYMSPEQARGNPDEIDSRTDVYGLGIILYEMLTGHFPYPVKGQLHVVLKHITETPPTPPSRSWKPESGVTTRQARRHRAGQCPIDDEVQTIVLRSLAKERDRRYQSAGELARDVDHYLRNEPIDAKRDSTWYVVSRVMSRHRRSLILTLCLLGICIYAIFLAAGLIQKEARARRALIASGERSRVMELLSAIDESWPKWSDAKNAHVFEELCDRIDEERATILDVEAFFRASTTLRLSVNDGEMVNLAGAAVLGTMIRTNGARVLNRNLGLLCDMELHVKGGERVIRSSSNPMWLLDPRIYGAASPRFAMPELGVGLHLVTLKARLRLVRLLKYDYRSANQVTPISDSPAEGVDYSLIRDYGTTLTETARILVVQEYPEDYPPMVVDEEVANEFDAGLSLDIVSADGAPAKDQGSSDMRIQISYVAPRIPIACSISFENFETYRVHISPIDGFISIAGPKGGSARYSPGRIEFANGARLSSGP